MRKGETAQVANDGVTKESGHSVSMSGEEVYKSVLRSAVFVFSVEKDAGNNITSLTSGSGTLVHKERRLVLTNYHVVGEQDRVSVFFPALTTTGELITDPSHYLKPIDKVRASARVVERDPRHDLALIELDQVPGFATALRLSRQPAQTGANLYSIGASGIELKSLRGALWRLSTGTARGRYQDTITLRSGQKVRATFLETQKPVNSGDSGGPTVNDRAELVGVVSAADPRKDLVYLDIDVTEVRAFLSDVAKKHSWQWEDAAAAPAPPALHQTSIPDLIAQTRSGDLKKRLEGFRQLGDMGADARQAVPNLIELLDDSEDQIRRAAASALEHVGPPAPEDMASVEKALVGPKFARQYALRFYGSKQKVSKEQLIRVINALDAKEPETRTLALSAIAFYGSDSKPTVLGRIIELCADPEAEVATLARQVLQSFGMFGESDVKILVEKLDSEQPLVRQQAVRMLAPLATDVHKSLKWFFSMLADKDPNVREQAILAISKWGKSAEAARARLLRRIDDENSKVRLAAIRAIGELGCGTEEISILAKFLSPDSELSHRHAAALVLSNSKLTDLKIHGPILTQLLADTDPIIRAGALSNLRAFGPAAEPYLSRVRALFQDADRDVQIKAVQAVAAMGPVAKTSASELIALITKSAARPEPPSSLESSSADQPLLNRVAIEALASFGPDISGELVRLLDAKLDKPTREQVCECLAGFGKRLPHSVIPSLLISAETDSEIRPAIANTLSKVGNDQVTSELLKRIEWSKGTNGKRTSKYPVDFTAWELNVMGSLTLKDMTEKQRKALLDKLGFEARSDPDSSCKTAARNALSKLEAQLPAINKKP